MLVMLKRLSISALLMLSTSVSFAEDMFSSSSEVSTHDAHCTKQEREAGRCDRDRRYTENQRPPQVYIEDNRRYDDRRDRRDYDDRRGYNNDRGYNDRRDYNRYDDRRDRRDYDDRRGHRPDPNWKEKHDIRTEDAFERQRRKDQEYYDKY